MKIYLVDSSNFSGEISGSKKKFDKALESNSKFIEVIDSGKRISRFVNKRNILFVEVEK